MFTLAINGKEAPVSIKSIAENQNISELYLEQIFSRLKQAKFIKSVRGAQGGYLLNREPGEITVGGIIRALEGPLAPADCVLEAGEGCENTDQCVTHFVWQRIYEGLNRVVDSITLQDMLDEYQKKNGKANCTC